jgi:hypothetical protein
VPAPAFRFLLPLLRDAEHARRLTLSDWDRALRLGRQARLLGLIGHRLAASETLWAALPPQVQGHLQAAIHYSAHRLQLVKMELSALDAALPPDAHFVLLKGAAYAAQALEFARGRLPNDVDLLVRRGDLDRVEAALHAAGWEPEANNDYDERYYREWSHELPPMRKPGHALEVDLHHTIAPVTSRTRADDALLFRDLVTLPGSRFFVLDPRDQLLHAAIHLFQDTELDGRLRDLVDIDGLIRRQLTDEADWAELLMRAERHRASRMLWYALHYCAAWLGTPVPAGLPLAPPPAAARRLMDWVLPRNCLPRLPDRAPGVTERIAAGVARVRYHCLRMPPGLLLRHLAHKGSRAVARWRSGGRRLTHYRA